MSAFKDPDLEHYTLSDSDDNLFDTPAPTNTKGKPNGKPVNAQPGKNRPAESHYDAEQAEKAHDVALRQELDNVRKINEVIEGVVESLEKAKSNMGTVSRTVNSASTLLQTWTRILSQTEHNQRLILNPAWQGANQDLADIENEEQHRHREAHRRQLEEQQRREAAARKAEEEERRREAAASRGTRGARGRARGAARASSSTAGSSSGYVSVGGQGGRGRGTTPSASRPGTGIGRGSRGRGRGLG